MPTVWVQCPIVTWTGHDRRQKRAPKISGHARNALGLDQMFDKGRKIRDRDTGAMRPAGFSWSMVDSLDGSQDWCVLKVSGRNLTELFDDPDVVLIADDDEIANPRAKGRVTDKTNVLNDRASIDHIRARVL